MGLLDRVKASQTGVSGAPGTVATPPPAAVPAGGNGAATPPPVPTGTRSGLPTMTPPAPVRPPAAVPARAPSPRPPSGVGTETTNPAFTAAKVHVHAKLLERYADKLQVTDRQGVKEKIQELTDEYFRLNAVTMTKVEKDRLVESLLDDVLGLGPLQQLVDDPEITEIMVNHPKQVYVERKGQPML